MSAHTLLAAALALAAGASPVAPLQWGNELTLPAQRHLVRMAPPGHPPYLLLSVQRDGQAGLGLVFFRSDDGGATWVPDAPIQNDRSERDEADLLPVGCTFTAAELYRAAEPLIKLAVKEDAPRLDGNVAALQNHAVSAHVEGGIDKHG